MATVDVHYNCGCGYSTTNPVEAVLHSNKHKHSLTVVGTITKPEKEK